MNAPRFFSRPAFLILLGAAILLLPTLFNGFPFTFPDSVDYLRIVSLVYRLPFYGAFVTLFHWNRFVWGPVLMQCLVVSHLLWLLIYVTSGKPTARTFLPFIATLTLLTGLSFFTGFLCADIFTPILFITYYILAFHYRQLSGWALYYLFLLAAIASVMHITNLSLGLGLVVLLMTLLKLTRTSWREIKQPLALIGIPTLLGITAVLLLNGLIFNIWSLSPAGKPFLLANMIEYGPARDYLDEACPTAHYRICKYRPYPTTANDIMWAENSVYYRLGGFITIRKEAATIIHETIRTRPREVANMVYDNFIAGLHTRAPAEEFYGKYQIQPFKDLLRNKFGEATFQQFMNSSEMRDTIPHETLETIDRIVPPFSFAALIIIALATLRSRGTAFTLSVATLCFILADTLLCTALSGVFDRYQARVAWLMPMVLGLLLIQHLRKKRA